LAFGWWGADAAAGAWAQAVRLLAERVLGSAAVVHSGELGKTGLVEHAHLLIGVLRSRWILCNGHDYSWPVVGVVEHKCLSW